MRKATDRLWAEAVREAFEKKANIQETFRRLAIENERECAEIVARVNAEGFIVEQGDLCLSPSMSLHTFPPEAINRNSVIEECATICDRFQSRDVGMQPAECAGAYKQGQERMRERAVSQAAEEAGEHGTDSDGWYICKSLAHQIEELEIEEPK